MNMNIDVTVSNVDLTSVVGQHREHDGEGGYYEAPMTLAHAVAKQIAEDLKRDASYPSLRERVRQIREDEIRAQLRPIIEAALEAPVQKTNSYGAPTGDLVSLTELVIKEVQAYLKRPTDSYDRNRGTVVQKFIREAVDSAIKKELADAIADEKAKVVAAVRAKAAELIAQAVREGVGR